MKKIIVFLIAIIACWSASAQSPEMFSYQSIIRDNSGNLLTNTNIGMKISIIQGSVGGTEVYAETHTPTSNANGLITLSIGDGNVVSGNFSTIDWSNGPYFIKTETDPSGGTNYTITGSSELLSVPYALYSAQTNITGNESAFNGWDKDTADDFSGNYNDLDNLPNLVDSIHYYADGSETNITAGQDISISGIGTSSDPYEISVTDKHYVGELYQGGVIFYVDHTGQHGLICSLVNLSVSTPWSNITDVEVGDSAQSDWNGQQNTLQIIAQPGHTSSAAQLCNDYTNANYGTGIYSDWYLPAIAQVTILFQELYEVNQSLDLDGDASTLALNHLFYYWSSTEHTIGGTNAKSVYFSSGQNIGNAKTFAAAVRAVRNF